MACDPSKCTCNKNGSRAGESVLLGAAIGTVFGMLFARRPGKELRKDLSRAGEKEGVLGAASVLGTELKSFGQDVAGATREALDSDAMQDAVSRVREKGEELMDRFRPEEDETPPPRPRKVPPKK